MYPQTGAVSQDIKSSGFAFLPPTIPDVSREVTGNILGTTVLSKTPDPTVTIREEPCIRVHESSVHIRFSSLKKAINIDERLLPIDISACYKPKGAEPKQQSALASATGWIGGIISPSWLWEGSPEQPPSRVKKD